ncbi:MAG: 2-C-methyl-D-erythritol 2,4-cyclodiphosphate synthase [Candidatus Omnitrophota bacterium]
MRIGLGYDIHPLVEKRKLFLGGIEIPFAKGLLGHSDADVLIHAISDALLGAMAKDDIGKHFPDSDPKYKDISSIELLKIVFDLVKANSFKISNIDTVILAEEPKIEPFRDRMREKIADTLNIDKNDINIKATTQEGLGLIGQNEAIASYAVVLLEK